MAENDHSFLSKVFVPLISFAVFLIPLLMDAIQIDFEAGEPKQLTGTDAIGVFLEPAEEGDGG